MIPKDSDFGIGEFADAYKGEIYVQPNTGRVYIRDSWGRLCRVTKYDEEAARPSFSRIRPIEESRGLMQEQRERQEAQRERKLVEEGKAGQCWDLFDKIHSAFADPEASKKTQEAKDAAVKASAAPAAAAASAQKEKRAAPAPAAKEAPATKEAPAPEPAKETPVAVAAKAAAGGDSTTSEKEARLQLAAAVQERAALKARLAASVRAPMSPCSARGEGRVPRPYLRCPSIAPIVGKLVPRTFPATLRRACRRAAAQHLCRTTGLAGCEPRRWRRQRRSAPQRRLRSDS